MTLQFSLVALLVALSVMIYTVMKTFQSLRAIDTWSEQGSQLFCQRARTDAWLLVQDLR
jgi:hypothetical protein